MLRTQRRSLLGHIEEQQSPQVAAVTLRLECDALSNECTVVITDAPMAITSAVIQWVGVNNAATAANHVIYCVRGGEFVIR